MSVQEARAVFRYDFSITFASKLIIINEISRYEPLSTENKTRFSTIQQYAKMNIEWVYESRNDGLNRSCQMNFLSDTDMPIVWSIFQEFIVIKIDASMNNWGKVISLLLESGIWISLEPESPNLSAKKK